MYQAVIVDAVRTPTGARNGLLASWHPATLAGRVLVALVQRNHLDPELIDEVIMGCASQVGEQAGNIARNAVLAAGLPEIIGATSVDRQCGSSQQALHYAAQAVMAGACDITIAAGVEVMSRVPPGAAVADGKYGLPFGPEVAARYADVGGLVPPGMAAEDIAERWGLQRRDLDAYAVGSHQRAAAAHRDGRFDGEIVPVTTVGGTSMSADETVNRSVTESSLAELPAAYCSDGVITAGNSAPVADGASAVLVMREDRAEALGLVPRARFVAFAGVGADPRLTFTAGPAATAAVLRRADLTLDDIDLIEFHEAYAAVVLAWAAETGVELARVNSNGGAIALGHALGASGTRQMATLVSRLGCSGGRYGLSIMCQGGGMANAAVIERI
jgi:acetyl-CoA acyltransferase